MSKESIGVTRDAILGGALTVLQPERGYRFSVDSVLLGRFATARPRDRVLELGAGCGVVAMMLARLGRAREVVALEIQPELAALIARSAALNGLANLRAIAADLRRRHIAGIEPQRFDLVVANPPFRAARTGRESPESGRRLARVERDATLADFAAAARRYARHGARVAFVFTAARAAELVATLRAHRLEPKRIRFVHPRIDAPASTVLIEARAGGGIEVRVEPPLVLYAHDRVYTDEARALLERA
jgi:tRNA1(Val) A37 N6-methylase TrmN6